MKASELLMRKFKIFFLKLPKKEQLLFLKEYFRYKYDLKEFLPEQFYELVLIKLKTDIEFFIKNKDIYQIIAEIKEIPIPNESLKLEITPCQYFEIQAQKVMLLKSMLEQLLAKCKEKKECYVLAYKLY